MNHPNHIRIPERLKPYVKHVWIMDDVDNKETPASFPIFADGCPGIIFQQSSSGMFLGNRKKLSPVFLYGQTVDPIVLNADRQCTMIGLIFQPHVLKSLFRFDAKEITDDCLDVKLMPAVPRINLTEQLWNTVAPGKQVELLFQYLECLVERNEAEPDKGLQYAAGRIMSLNGSVSLRELQSALNLSERTFERRFEQHIGISPKLLASIAQFQASLMQLKSKKFSKLSDIAYENGYADQSHFIRSFKKFTGLSPLAFHKQAGGYQELPIFG